MSKDEMRTPGGNDELSQPAKLDELEHPATPDELAQPATPDELAQPGGTDEFQHLWKAYDVKLQRSLKLNQRLLEEIQTRKVRISFNWQIGFKVMVILLGIGMNIVLGSLLWRFHSNPVFAVSAGLIILFTSYCIAGYFLQMLLMLSINLSKSILATQRQLAQLEAVIVWTLRVSFLQAPVWPFLFVPKILPAGAAPLYWTIEGVVVLVLLLVVIWMYQRITVAGASRGWVKRIVDNEGGKSIARARAFIKEIEEYQKEDSDSNL
ncbi:MAG TPA: hypothetical protein VL727_11150 [Puia sp.]|nr:hypothetical protein [Puia sp.]